MNNKKLLAFLFAGIVIILLILFGISRCEPRAKEDNINNPDSQEQSEEIEAVDDSVLEQYRSAFVQANIDFGCDLIEAPEIESSSEIFQATLNVNFAKNNLPVDNDALMVQILQKYGDDESVLSEIEAGIEDCKNI